MDSGLRQNDSGEKGRGGNALGHSVEKRNPGRTDNNWIPICIGMVGGKGERGKTIERGLRPLSRRTPA